MQRQMWKLGVILSLVVVVLSCTSNGILAQEMPENVKKMLEAAVDNKKAGNIAQYESVHRKIVSEYPGSDFALASQIAIVQNCFDQKDYIAAEKEMTLLKESFSDTQGIAKGIHDLAQMYKNAGKREEALNWHRYNVAKYPDTFEGAVSQLEIVYDGFDRKDYDFVNKEAGFLLDNFSSRTGMSYGVYMVGKKYQDAGFVDKAEKIYRQCVSDAQGLGAMLAQKEIIFNRLSKKSFNEAVSELDLFKDIFADTEGVSKQLFEIAQRYQRDGRLADAVILHRYNVDKYSDTFDGKVSQLEIVYDAFNRKDYDSVDKEANYLLDNFSKSSGMSYGMYMIGKRYQEAGFNDRGLMVYRKCVEDAKGLGAMLSLVGIIDDCFANNDVASATSYGADLCSRFKDESGISGQLFQLAQKHVSVGDHDTAIKYYKFNMEKYP
ncbi:MAG: hypothetical protein GX587_04640, partial [Bacteroidales bacterium]|nr:hypothetical protein [Bacteroidales bacterium]